MPSAGEPVASLYAESRNAALFPHGGFVQRCILSSLAIIWLGACRAPGTISNSTPAREAQRAARGQFDIAYRIAMPDLASHLYDVRIDIDNVSGDDLRLQMPVWSPGRYARFDFARTVQDLTIAGNGAPLRWERENGSVWHVHLAGVRSVAVRYRVFANTLSGTFSVLDSAHGNWNGASLFMYVVDHKPDPVSLHVTPPAGWHIVNGDARTPDQTDYRFENYDRLIDTPTEVAPALMIDTVNVDGRLYRTMVHHNGASTTGQRRRFIGDVQKIVRYENTVFGPPPLEMYTFVFNIGYPGG